MRVKIFHLTAIGMLTFLLLSLFSMQVVRGRAYRSLSDKNCIRLIPQKGSRGDITDRNGTVIAGSAIAYDIVILPQEVAQIDKTLIALSRVVGIEPAQLRKNFRRFYTSPSMPVTVLKNVDKEKAMRVEELKLDLDGIIVQSLPLRTYPFGKLACHVLGYLSEIDHWRLMKLEDYGYKVGNIVGNGGVEEKYDYYVRQEDGGLSVEVDHQGRFTRVLGFRSPQKGKDLQLTVDWRIQKIAEDALQDFRGAVVVLDVFTGEIMALASAPAFDPSAFVARDMLSINRSFTDPAAPLFNRAISGSYPPGSVFKVISAYGALDRSKVSPETTFYCPGSAQIGRRQFKCWGVHNDQSLVAAIAHSCDVYFYRLGLLLGGQAIHDYAVKFGLGKTSGVELPYEATGFIPNPIWKKLYRLQKWYDGDTANFVIGQGELLTSPLQLARLMAVFANGGNLVTPFIVKAIGGQDVTAGHKRVVPLHLKPAALRSVKEGLRQVVADEQGTAGMLKSAPVSIAGKTGTAEINKVDAHAWFAGFFPYERPRFAICVFLEKGGHGYQASMLTKTIVEMMFQEGLL
ncbi:MAG TPA: penicillin-binding protein 2 [Candidatus Omnitrophota bacterium]|nr:penicillin-binding protein 2 [Candidatus Omnitrophota bacterium]HRZ15270.1 penicillin-binding protein 2 [Candidatus Omnitrophota bacterium]